MAVLIPSARSHLQIAGRVFTDLTNLIVVYGGVNTLLRFTGMRVPNGTAARQTTSGKTFTIYAVDPVSGGGGNFIYYLLLYGDTDVGLDSSSAPTNAVYLAADSGNGIVASLATSASGGSISKSGGNPHFSIPSQKYPTIKASVANAGIYAYGYEV
jgi:hypothetical protein